jgi:hypothetical protein
MAAIYRRTLGGKVTFIDAMTRDDVAFAVARAPWEWSTEPRGFAKWPADRVRGDPVEPPSLADTWPRNGADSIWVDRA